MKVTPTRLEGVFILEPAVYSDHRGSFFESFSEKDFTGRLIETHFVQDNESESVYGVVRGLHYQLPPYSQSKLVRVPVGKVIDVAVDIRKGSPTFGQYVAVELSGENRLQLFIPRGFAHGFSVLSPRAIFQYKCDNYYSPGSEGSIRADDPRLSIDWGLPAEDIILSDKDRDAARFEDAPLFEYNEKLY